MKKKTKRIITICAVAFVVLIVAGLWTCTVIAYNQNFDNRFTSYEPEMLSIDDFDNLERTRYTFTSNKGQLLTGYMYSANNGASGKKAILVLAHGFGGGGHNSYMNCIDVFANNGYLVFAYDATGNDESEGLGKSNGVGGLPQGVIDLDYAISFVEKSGNFPELPIVLFGHSWGGYSVCNVLSYHPEVKAVAECAGFESSIGMFEAEGKNIAGNAIKLFLPFFRIHELIKYGNYALSSGVKGLKDSGAKATIIHSKNDTTVPVEYGYSIYYEEFKDDPKVSFILFEDKGHSNLLRSQEGIDYLKAFNAKFDEVFKAKDYDYKAAENNERFAKEKAEYIHENLDRRIFSHSANKELLLSLIAFYDEAVK